MRSNYAIFLVLAWLSACLPSLKAQQSRLLAKEVISREVSLAIGRVDSPNYQEIVSREMSFFIGSEPPSPYRDLVSREMTFVVALTNPPAPVQGLLVTSPPAGGTATLSWRSYNQWAQSDVGSYWIFVSTTPFTNVTGMTPVIQVPGETLTCTLSNLPTGENLYFAVVPVDVTTNFVAAVNFAGAYPVARELVSRETALFIGGEPPSPYHDIVSREATIVVSTGVPPAPVTGLQVTSSPDGSTAILSWANYNQWAQQDVASYDIYYSDHAFANVIGMTPVGIVPGETLTFTLTNLPTGLDHFFAVVPVASSGLAYSGVNFAASYIVAREVVSRETAVFVGGDAPDGYRDLVSRELTVVVASTNAPGPIASQQGALIASTSTSAYGAINLDWSGYNFLAQGDITNYLIYVSPTYFTQVTNLAPFAYAPAETTSWVLRGLVPLGVYYVAVVPVDALGRFSTVVTSVSAQASIGVLGEVGNLQAVSGSSSIEFDWTPPSGAGTFLAEYRLYIGNSTTPLTLSPTAVTYAATGLQPAEPYSVRITTVDIFGQESSGVSLVAATLLAPPANLTAEALNQFVGLSWNASLPSQILKQYDVYISLTNFTSIAGITPALTTVQNQANISNLLNGQTYYFAVTAVNISGGASDLSQVVSATPEVVTNASSYLRIIVSPAVAYLGPDQNFSYSVTVTNTGITNLIGVSLVDALPPGLELESVTYGRGSADIGDNSFTWSVGNMATNSAFTMTVEVASGVLTNLVKLTNSISAADAGGLASASAIQILNLNAGLPAPILPLISNQVVNELTPLFVTNTASESDPAAVLVYTLIQPPAGMSISSNGIISWTPAQTQSPGTNTITTVVTATDSAISGAAPESATNSFVVVVKEVNVAPVLPLVSNQYVTELSRLIVSNTAAEPNFHAALAYTLTNPPVGLSISTNGIITWTPSTAQSSTTNMVTTVVTATDPFDPINPVLSATNSFIVIVNPGLLITGAKWEKGGLFQFTINSGAGTNYVVESSTNLMNWNFVLEIQGSGGPLTVVDPNAGANSESFYRVKTGAQ